jgi:hypothetical protein
VSPARIIKSKPHLGRTLPYKVPLEVPQRFVRKPYIKITTVITSSWALSLIFVQTLELSQKQQSRKFTLLGDRMCHREVQSRARKHVKKIRGHSQFIVCLFWILQPVVVFFCQNCFAWTCMSRLCSWQLWQLPLLSRHCLRLSGGKAGC